MSRKKFAIWTNMRQNTSETRLGCDTRHRLARPCRARKEAASEGTAKLSRTRCVLTDRQQNGRKKAKLWPLRKGPFDQ